ncbi:MAG: hypothetical protein WBW88_09120 [Rhodothermales bacterium]
MERRPSILTLAALLAVVALLRTENAFSQQRIGFAIGETEKNAVIFRIGQWTIPELLKNLTIEVDEPSGKATPVVLFSGLIRGDKLVSLDESEVFEIKVRYAPGEKLLHLSKLFDRTDRLPVVSEQKVLPASTYPTITFDVASKAYGLVAPRRDPPAINPLNRYVIPGVRRARKANGRPDAEALVLFLTGPKSCGDKCAVETQVLTLLLDVPK